MASSPGISARATSADQRSPCDKLAAWSILSGGIWRGSSFLNEAQIAETLGVHVGTVKSQLAKARRNLAAKGGLGAGGRDA